MLDAWIGFSILCKGSDEEKLDRTSKTRSLEIERVYQSLDINRMVMIA